MDAAQARAPAASVSSACAAAGVFNAATNGAQEKKGELLSLRAGEPQILPVGIEFVEVSAWGSSAWRLAPSGVPGREDGLARVP